MSPSLAPAPRRPDPSPPDPHGDEPVAAVAARGAQRTRNAATRIIVVLALGAIVALPAGRTDMALKLAAIVLPLLIARAAGVSERLLLVAAVAFALETISTIAGFYERIAWWDTVPHVLIPVVAALMVVDLAERTGRRPDPRQAALLCIASAAVIGGLWELAELASDAVAGSQFSLGARDTFSDLTCDIAGGALAATGLLLKRMRRAVAAVPALVVLVAAGAGSVALETAQASVRLIWQDGFAGAAGDRPDARSWQASTGGQGWGNNELQTYTDQPTNASLDGAGHLLLTARSERVTGADGITRDFTSARLSTQHRFSFRYGRVEAVIRVPAGKGLLAQFWALGEDVDTAGWPASGELDVMEVLGNAPNRVIASVHGPLTRGPKDRDWARNTQTQAPASLAGGFHTYGMTWTPWQVSMSLDGRTYAIYRRSATPVGGSWPFDKPFFLVLTLAVGGNWPGAPTAATQFPATMAVDSIRVWSTSKEGQ